MLNYDKLMALNPTQYDKHIVNSLGQTIYFFENPLLGSDATVIAVCHELRLADSTTFFDLEDFNIEGSEYNPVFFKHGHKHYELINEFELDDYKAEAEGVDR